TQRVRSGPQTPQGARSHDARLTAPSPTASPQRRTLRSAASWVGPTDATFTSLPRLPRTANKRVHLGRARCGAYALRCPPVDALNRSPAFLNISQFVDLRS